MKFKILSEGKNLQNTIDQYMDKIKQSATGMHSYQQDMKNLKDIGDIEDIKTEASKRFIKTLISYDPTYKEGSNTTGLYGTWIINLFLRNPGDFSSWEVTDTLTKFENSKSMIADKDINHYKTIAELKDAIADASPSARQIERQSRNASSKIKKVWENDNWAIYMPLNYEGSLTLGKGSDWCTADSRTAKYYVQYALGDYTAQSSYYDIASDDFDYEDWKADIEREMPGAPDTLEGLIQEFSNRGVLVSDDFGDTYIVNPYDPMWTTDKIYVFINKHKSSEKFQIAFSFDYEWGGYTLADIYDDLWDIVKFLNYAPDLYEWFKDECPYVLDDLNEYEAELEAKQEAEKDEI